MRKFSRLALLFEYDDTIVVHKCNAGGYEFLDAKSASLKQKEWLICSMWFLENESGFHFKDNPMSEEFKALIDRSRMDKLIANPKNIEKRRSL